MTPTIAPLAYLYSFIAGDGGGGGGGGGSSSTVLRLGSAGSSVTWTQEILSALGYSVRVTGVFDYATDQAVRQFQAASGLTVDGAVGTLTQSALAGASARGQGGAPAQQQGDAQQQAAQGAQIAITPATASSKVGPVLAVLALFTVGGLAIGFALKR